MTPRSVVLGLAATSLLGCASSPVSLAPGRVPGPPPTVLAYGGTSRSLSAHLEDASAVMAAVTGQRQALLPMLQGGLQQMLGLAGTDGIDFQRPLRFMVVDSKICEDGVPMLLAVGASRAALEPNLPSPEPTKLGLRFTLPSGKPADIAFADDVALISMCGEAVLGTHLAFGRALFAAPLPEGIAVVGDMKNIAKRHGREIESFLAGMKQGTLAAFEETPTFNPKQAEAFVGMYDFLGRAVNEATSARLQIAFDTRGVRIDSDVAFAPESPTGKLLAPVRTSPSGVAAKLPADAVAWMLTGLDKSSATDLLAALEPWMASLAGMEAGSSSFLTRFMGNDTGFALAPLASGEVAAVLRTAFGSSEEAAKAKLELLELYGSKDYRESLQASGMTLAIQPDAYQLDGATVTEVEMQSSMPPQVPAAAMVQALMSWIGSVQIVAHDSELLYTYGPDRRAVLERTHRGTLPGGLDTSPEVRSVRSQAAPSPIMIAYADLIGVAKLFPQLSENPQAATLLRAIGRTAPLHYSLGVPDGRLHGSFYISNQLSKAIFTGVMMANQARQ